MPFRNISIITSIKNFNENFLKLSFSQNSFFSLFPQNFKTCSRWMSRIIQQLSSEWFSELFIYFSLHHNFTSHPISSLFKIHRPTVLDASFCCSFYTKNNSRVELFFTFFLFFLFGDTWTNRDGEGSGEKKEMIHETYIDMISFFRRLKI